MASRPRGEGVGDSCRTNRQPNRKTDDHQPSEPLQEARMPLQGFAFHRRRSSELAVPAGFACVGRRMRTEDASMPDRRGARSLSSVEVRPRRMAI